MRRAKAPPASRRQSDPIKRCHFTATVGYGTGFHLDICSKLTVALLGTSETVAAIPRYRNHSGPVILSAGFRPFFLASSIWAAVAVPIWLGAYAEGLIVPTRLSPAVWHAHEMVFGFAAATVAGFLLTAIPNWTGRLPIQGTSLAIILLLWAIGRAAVLMSAIIGAPAAAVADLAFPTVFLAAVAREIVAGKNWRNLPMVGALAFLLLSNLLVHLGATGVADTAELGNRLGIVTLLTLISLDPPPIEPSFTRNWLAKMLPDVPPPVPENRWDLAVLVVTALALLGWVFVPNSVWTACVLTLAGAGVVTRLSRWRGLRTIREPLLLVLHLGYGWLAVGLLLLGLNALFAFLPATAALHALTVGAIGTMTLAVMTRASLGHTGRPLTAGPVTKTIYALVTIAAILRVIAPLCASLVVVVLWLAAAAWSGAFGLFGVAYGKLLIRPRIRSEAAQPFESPAAAPAQERCKYQSGNQRSA